MAIPRTADGHPNFSGFWQALNTANWDIEPHHARPGSPPGLGIVVDGPLPYRSEALAKRRENWRDRAKQGDIFYDKGRLSDDAPHCGCYDG